MMYIPLLPPGASIDVAPMPEWFMLALLCLTLLSLMAALMTLALGRKVTFPSQGGGHSTRGQGQSSYDLALVQLGEARGRQQILDEVRMLEHGQLKAHVLAVQQCIVRAQGLDHSTSSLEAFLAEAMEQTNRLLKVVVSLHQAVSDSALPDDLEQTVVEVARSLSAVYPACGCRVEVLGERRSTVAEPVKRALTLVLYNAANNALIHGQPSQLVIQLRYAPDALILEVNDNGKGMVETERRAGGRGLRDVRQLIESLQGTLTVTSTAMVGTTLTALVPLPRAD